MMQQIDYPMRHHHEQSHDDQLKLQFEGEFAPHLEGSTPHRTLYLLKDFCHVAVTKLANRAFLKCSAHKRKMRFLTIPLCGLS